MALLRMVKLSLKSFFLAGLLCLFFNSSTAVAETSIIKAGSMLDVRSGKLSGPVSVVIEDGLGHSGCGVCGPDIAGRFYNGARCRCQCWIP